MKTNKKVKLVLLLVWSVLLTAFTVFLGSAPMKVYRSLTGKSLFWLSVLGLVLVLCGLKFWVLAVTIASMMTLVGTYTDLEEHNHGVGYSGACALMMTTLLQAAGFAVWVSMTGAGWYNTLLSWVEKAVAPYTEVTGIKLDIASLLAQAPSGLITVSALSLFVMLVLENRVRFLVGLPPKDQKGIVDFRVPDVCVWVFAASMLGAFLKYDIKWLQLSSMNVFNVVLVLYFLQGMAVVFKFFETFRVGAFWRVFMSVFLVLQLFLFVSVLGLADYWLDFRVKLAKKATDINKQMYE